MHSSGSTGVVAGGAGAVSVRPDAGAGPLAGMVGPVHRARVGDRYPVLVRARALRAGPHRPVRAAPVRALRVVDALGTPALHWSAPSRLGRYRDGPAGLGERRVLPTGVLVALGHHRQDSAEHATGDPAYRRCGRLDLTLGRLAVAADDDRAIGGGSDHRGVADRQQRRGIEEDDVVAL